MLGINTLQNKLKGFTIVEVIIVIVVLGILIGIVLLSYSSVLNNSKTHSLKADASTAYSKLVKYRADNGTYPTALSAAGISNSTTTTYAYTYTSGTDSYCLQVTGYKMIYHVNNGKSEPVAGIC